MCVSRHSGLEDPPTAAIFVGTDAQNFRQQTDDPLGPGEHDSNRYKYYQQGTDNDLLVIF